MFVHSEERNFKCSYVGCTSSFKMNKQLSYHYEIEHNKNQELIMQRRRQKERENKRRMMVREAQRIEIEKHKSVFKPRMIKTDE